MVALRYNAVHTPTDIRRRSVSERRWGFSAEEWSARRSVLERLLVETATARSTITYGEVARRVFDGRVSARSSAIVAMLGEVDDAAYSEDGIMIASLVVRADTGMPGEGYFIFAAEQLGLPALDDRRAFWERQVSRVWDSYAPTAAPGGGVASAVGRSLHESSEVRS
jgi:hypothetical protein